MKKILILASALLCIVAYSSEVLTLYQKGQIFPSVNGGESTAGKRLAEDIRHYFRKVTGVDMKNTGVPEILLEIVPDSEKDAESFEILVSEAKIVRIESPTEWGLAHGVNEFIESSLGVRWLFPEEIGEYIPKLDVITVKPQYSSPSMLMRTFAFVHSHKQQYDWARRNKANFGEVRQLPGRIWGTHNLGQLFTIAGVTPQKNPELYPILGGKRFFPKPDDYVFWQPCFTESGTVDALVAGLQAQLKVEPNVSFGVNDGAHHCECPRCLEVDGKRKNRFGFDHRSESYFLCINKVAEKCAAPGRLFGFSAYDCIAEVPMTVKPHPSLRPYITYSRLQWCDPVRRSNDQKNIKAWADLCGSVIMRDYFQLRDSVLPKVYFKLFSEYLRWGAKNGVRFYYSEVYPNDDWISGPMLYMVLKLAWNPELDYRAVLDEWYTAAVGEKAAPYLAKYFEICSDYWENHVQKTAWFQPERQYMMDGSFGYLDAFDFQQLDKMRELLEKTLALSNHKARAKFFLEAFSRRETMIRQYEKNLELQRSLVKLSFHPVAEFDFAQPEKRWSSWQRTAGKGTFFHSQDEGGTLVMNPEGAFKDMVYMTNIPAVPGHVYRVRARVKMMNTTPDATVKVTMAWGAGGKNWLSSSYNAECALKEDFAFKWRDISVAAIAPEEQGVFLRVMLSLDKTTKGLVYWDNVRIEEAQNHNL